jgi:magnesium-protoporphyrin O-methyltransferase
VLDVGCGIGDLAIEVVTRGAARGTGYDLSSKAIEEARKLAAARGVGDRMRFEVGDGAKLRLPAADIVVINRVVCCYPDTENLLEHTLGAAGSVFAMTAPVSNGATGWLNHGLRTASQEVRRVPNVHP